MAGGVRLFDDPFARSFLPAIPAATAYIANIPVLGAAVTATAELLAPGARGIAVGRTRFIDDALLSAVKEVDQIVILGAGYDSRAYRLTLPSDVSVFEVDHPATQARKRRTLAPLLRRTPSRVTFVAVDFDRDSLASALAANGFAAGRRNFFIWEGVTEYLQPTSVDATLQFVVEASAPGTWLAFTYTDIRLIDGRKRFRGGRRLLALSRLGGEPYCFGIDPSDLRAFLAGRHFELIEDIAGAGYAQRYFAPRGRRIAGNEYERTALARVPATPSSNGTQTTAFAAGPVGA
jgi:methyltransferase (TIGR00027 family)